MAHPWSHSISSSRKFGGKPEDYLEIHNWFDSTKSYCADPRHRSLRHHTLGIFDCEKVFGVFIMNSDNKKVMVRQVGEQHVFEDLGFIPTPMDWLKYMSIPRNMNKPKIIDIEQ